MNALGTMSAAASPSDAAAAAAIVVVGAGAKLVGRRPAGRLAKRDDGVDVEGRRLGREEKDLWAGGEGQHGVFPGDSSGGGSCLAYLVVKPGCRAASRMAARSADWAKRRDIVVCG